MTASHPPRIPNNADGAQINANVHTTQQQSAQNVPAQHVLTPFQPYGSAQQIKYERYECNKWSNQIQGQSSTDCTDKGYARTVNQKHGMLNSIIVIVFDCSIYCIHTVRI